MIVKPETLIGWHRQAGLRDPAEREASSNDHEGVGCPLQSGTTSRELGPGIPDSDSRPRPRPSIHGHELLANCRIRARDGLGGLHHEYWLEEIAA